jgi:uracil-DNA glycosylase
MSFPHWLKVLNAEVVACTRCPRLVAYRERIAREKRRAYRGCEYWGKPVPGFGDPHARVLVLGLAPGAPPDNKPLPEELANCAPFLERELEGLKDLRVIVALGRIGFDAYLNYLKRRKLIAGKREYQFRHGAKYVLPDGRVLLASYHPSNQNTNTGKLTRQMFVEIFREARRLADRT